MARDAPGEPALEVSFQIHFGGDLQLCKAFLARCRENPAAALKWGSIIPGTSPMAVPDTQSAIFTLEEVCDSGTQPGAAAASALRPSSERSVVPARPLTDIELPYKSYRVRPVRVPLCVCCADSSASVCSSLVQTGGALSALTSIHTS